MHLRSAVGAVCVFVFSWVFTTIVHASEPFPAQMTVEILQAPSPLIALDKAYLVYELHLTNYHTAPAVLTSIEVQDGFKSYQFKGTELTKIIHAIGAKGSDKASLSFLPGQSKIAFMWLPLESQNKIPVNLIHKVNLNTSIHGKETKLALTTDPLAVNQTLPLIVKSPLKGDYWVAGNAPSNRSDHRTANLVVNGVDYFAQRYAIDFIQMGQDGNSYAGDEHKNQSYHCYGKNIYSVASGTVVALKDGLPENIPHSNKPAVPISMETLGGNFIVVDLGKQHYAFYAHLIPESLKVKIGDKVTQGQIIGKVGNTGNSSEPHLHFHIVNKPSFIGANGIPYGFDRFDVRPSQVVDAKVFRMKFLDGEWKHYTNQLVLDNTTMKFLDE